MAAGKHSRDTKKALQSVIRGTNETEDTYLRLIEKNDNELS